MFECKLQKKETYLRNGSPFPFGNSYLNILFAALYNVQIILWLGNKLSKIQYVKYAIKITNTAKIIKYKINLFIVHNSIGTRRRWRGCTLEI